MLGIIILTICIYEFFALMWATDNSQSRLSKLLHLLNTVSPKTDVRKSKILVSFLDNVNMASIKYNVDIPISLENMTDYTIWTKYPCDETFIGNIKVVNLAFYRNKIKPKLNKLISWFYT